MTTQEPVAAPSLTLLARVWTGIGLQSFGGGSAMLTLIQQEIVERRGWITPEVFVRDWAMCQLTPGVNLIAFPLLLGKRIAGWRGMMIALSGLLLPCVLLTIALTAVYARVQTLPRMRAAIQGAIPGSVGLGLVTAWRMAAPHLRSARAEGAGSLTLALILLLVSGLLVGVLRWPVFAVLIGAALLGALLFRTRVAGEPTPTELAPVRDETGETS